jgi:hypothetical protein
LVADYVLLYELTRLIEFFSPPASLEATESTEENFFFLAGRRRQETNLSPPGGFAVPYVAAGMIILICLLLPRQDGMTDLIL